MGICLRVHGPAIVDDHVEGDATAWISESLLIRRPEGYSRHGENDYEYVVEVLDLPVPDSDRKTNWNDAYEVTVAVDSRQFDKEVTIPVDRAEEVHFDHTNRKLGRLWLSEQRYILEGLLTPYKPMHHQPWEEYHDEARGDRLTDLSTATRYAPSARGRGAGDDPDADGFDTDTLYTDTASSQQDCVDAIVEATEALCDSGSDDFAERSGIVELAAARGHDPTRVRDTIDRLAREGERLYSPEGDERYKAL